MTDLDFEDPFDAPKARKPSTPKAALDFKDPFESAPAPKPSGTRSDESALSKAGKFVAEQFKGTGDVPYQDAIDNPVTRGLAQAGNTGLTGITHIGRRLVGAISPEAGEAIRKNVEQPLVERGEQLATPKDAGFGASVLQTLANVGGQLSLARATGGGSALGVAGRLGIPSAGAEAAQREAATGEEVSAPQLAGMAAASTIANTIGLKLPGGLPGRIAGGAIANVAGTALSNVAAGNDPLQGAVPAALLGAGLGALPHGERAAPESTHAPEAARKPVAAGLDFTDPFEHDDSATDFVVGANGETVPTRPASAARAAGPIATPDDAAIVSQRLNPSGPLGIAAAQLRTSAEAAPIAGSEVDARGTREPPTLAPIDSPLEAAARASAAHPDNELPEPTAAQHEAGNFKAGHVDLHGLDVTLQVPKGAMRRGIDGQGNEWQRPASDHYGQIRGTESADGEPLDAYFGPHAEDHDAKVFVVDQVKHDSGDFDEHKAMVGYNNEADALRAYRANFPRDMDLVGGVKPMSLDEFKDWVHHGDTTKPAADADTAGIANQAKAAERARRNLGPIEAEGKRDFGTVWERARQTLADDPQQGNRLTNEVAAHPRALNAEESAVLIQHGAALNSRYDHTLREIEAAQKSGDTAGEAQAQVRRRELEEQLQVHDHAARQSGYEQGLGLAMRAALAKRDYSMARQVARFRAIEGGEIPKNVRAQLDTMTKQIADLNDQIRSRDERIAKNAATNGAERRRAAPKSTQQQHAQLKAQLEELVGDRRAPSRDAARESVGEAPGAHAAEHQSTEPASPKQQRIAQAARDYFDRLPQEVGWDQVGGKLLRSPDEAGQGGHAPVIGRTQWVGQLGPMGESGLWRHRPDKITEAQAHEAFRKAAAGEKLKPIEQRFIDHARKTAQHYAEQEEAAREESAKQRGFDSVEAMHEHDAINPFGAEHYDGSPREDIPFSRGARGGSTRETLQAAISNTVRGWQGDAPRVLVHQSHNEAPARLRNAHGFDRSVEGAYDPHTGTVHMFADAIKTPQRAAQVLAHEVIGHYGVEGVLGKDWGKFVGDVTALRAKAPKALRDVFAEVDRRYPGADAETFASEAMAVMAEKGIHNALMDRVITAVRQFLRRLGINAKFSDAELRQMLVAAHRRVAAGAPDSVGRAAVSAFSKADKTDSPEFNRWFGKSKVADAAGRPRLTFHGTADDFNEFRDEHAGRSTGHMTAPLGHFFAEDRNSAQRYAEKASEGVPADERVISAYLSIEKPFTMKLKDFMQIDSQDEARALRAKLQREGYDGIHMPDAGKGQWIAFDSRQVKSTENRGTFDRTNPDIRFSRDDAERQDRIAAIVKQMARNRVAAGETNPRALIDWLHGEVGALAGLSRQQVHAIIAGVHSGAKPTRSELQQRLSAVRSQLRQELKNPDEQRNATRQAALQRQIEEIQRRITSGDFSKVKRAPFTYDEKTFAFEVQRNRLQRQLEALAMKREQAQKNPVARFSDFLVKLHRFNILSSPLVVPKLLSAATAKIAVTPLEELAGSVLRHIPGIDRIAAMAPRHGAGFTLGAEREGLRGAFSKETAQGARDQVMHGHDALDELYGDKLHRTQEWTNFMGNIHSALKEPAMLNEFYRSYFLRAQHERARVIGEGRSPDQADAYMQRPSTQAMIGAKAYADGAAAKMQGKNQFADAIDSALRTAKQQGGPMGALAKLFEVVFPIRKVPLNIVKEITSYAAGGIKAGVGAVTWRGELTPERADYILKNLKQQSVGTALLVLGYAFSQSFGGTHQEGDKKRNPNVKPGEAKIGGAEVPELFFHSPAAQTVQIGAGLARIYQQEYGKTHNGFDAGLHSLLANYGSTLERGIPYLDQPRRISNTLKYGRGAGEVVGDQLRSMFVPQVLQRVAQSQDPYKGFRKPKSVAQDVALGIPGLREKVPK